VGVAPETISPAKFYPKVVTATFLYLHEQQWERQWRQQHPHHHLCLVAGRRRWRRTAPGPVQVERRDEHRRHSRFCAAAVIGNPSRTSGAVDASSSELS